MENVNTARRFLVAVDAAYECRCKIVLNSTVPLDDLFPEEFFDTSLPTHQSKTTVKGMGGASAQFSTTFVDSDTEWSATGIMGAALSRFSQTKDVGFAARRAISRLKEMQSSLWDL